MARRRHPPLPSAVRPFYRALRTFGVLVGLGALYVGVVAAGRGSWSITFLVFIVGGGFAALTWMHPQSGWFASTLTGLAGLGLVAAAMLRSWTVALTLAGTVGLVVWSRRLRPGGRGALRVDPDKIVLDGPSAVMKNARAFVDEFQAAGFSTGEKPDLPLTDVVMPDLSGPRLAARLAAQIPGLPVLYMSGYTSEGRGDMPMDDAQLIHKPFSHLHLLERVAQMLPPGSRS